MKVLNTQGIWSDFTNSSTTGTRYYGRNISVPNTGAATVIINFAITASNPGVYLYLRTFLMAERQSGTIAENYAIASWVTFRSNSGGGFDMTDEQFLWSDGNFIISSGWQNTTGTGGYARWQANTGGSTNCWTTMYMTSQCNDWSKVTVTFP